MHSLPSVPTDRHAQSVSWLALLLPALPAVAIVLLWWPALPASFQFDDWNVIVNEPRVHSLAAWWQSMPGIRPLLKLSYALNMSMDASPTGFRVVNILIHSLSAALVWSLLRTRGIRAGLTEADAARAAMVAALIFALHPVQTEAVTYISGRSSSLAACWCLLSLYCWVRSEQTEHPPAIAGWLAACCLCFGFAVATKETALVLPLALLLYSADRPVSVTMNRLTPLLLLTALMLCVALSMPTYRRLLAVSLETRTVAENLVTQSQALLYLAGQLLRIWNSNADPQLIVVTSLNWVSASLCTAWVGVIVIAMSRVRRAPIGAFAVLWFLLWLAPTNSLLPRLDIANDRQLYLALIGPAWWLATRLISRDRARPLASVVIAALLIALSWSTYARNRVYETEIGFWQDAAGRNPDNSRAANNLGMAYAIDCRFDEAVEAFRRAIVLSPDEYHAQINLVLLRQGQLPGVDPQRCSLTRKND